jgi:hypothetical protein
MRVFAFLSLLQFMRREDMQRVGEAINQVREMLTIGADDLSPVFEQAICSHPEVSTHSERAPLPPLFLSLF